MYNTEIKKKVIELRKLGYSYSYIKTKFALSKSTLSKWLSDIEFKPNEYTLDKIKEARLASTLHKIKIKFENIEKAKKQSEKDINYLTKRDIMMIGIGIYIGEGSKTINLTRIINSDPKVIKFTIKWFKTCFGIKNKNFAIRLHIYPDNKEEDCINFWSKETKIPRDQFYKCTIDKRTDKKIRNINKLPYGTAHMTIKSLGNKEFGVYLHRRIMAWINKVL